jgi:hypothetical protein
MAHIGWLVLVAVLLVAPGRGQGVNPAHPTEINAQKHVSPDEMRERASNAQLQQDAKELAGLCNAVSTDMDGVQHGVLSKDLLDRLKRMERLSKRVREQLSKSASVR